MKFFTLDLIRKLNSKDEDEAEDADDEWDRRLHEYQDSIQKIGAALPGGLVGVDLHDAKMEVFSFEKKLIDDTKSAELVLKCKLNNQAIVMKYTDVKKMCFDNLKKRDESVLVFSEDSFGGWLADEISQVDEGTYQHEILFDNGDFILCVFKGFCFEK